MFDLPSLWLGRAYPKLRHGSPNPDLQMYRERSGKNAGLGELWIEFKRNRPRVSEETPPFLALGSFVCRLLGCVRRFGDLGGN